MVYLQNVLDKPVSRLSLMYILVIDYTGLVYVPLLFLSLVNLRAMRGPERTIKNNEAQEGRHPIIGSIFTRLKKYHFFLFMLFC